MVSACRLLSVLAIVLMLMVISVRAKGGKGVIVCMRIKVLEIRPRDPRVWGRDGGNEKEEGLCVAFCVSKSAFNPL